ncbi:MAG: hypothetical protein HQL46_12070 [Gammaproteobacteria bacterium]|nr:hypothetical protein [Gammaproteobacteria bacterium]
MSEAQLSEANFIHINENEFKLSGNLTTQTVGYLLKDETKKFVDCIKKESDNKLDINLQEIIKSDSSGIAFIIELIRLAHTYHKEIIFHNVPEQMLAIAKLSSVDELLLNKK